jgi:hypothetical protein
VTRAESILVAFSSLCAGPPTVGIEEKRDFTIGHNDFVLSIPDSWKVVLRSGFESENYLFSDGKQPLFVIYRGNNPDLRWIGLNRDHRPIQLNSNMGTEYRSAGVITDIVLTPHCGPDRYVWIRVLDKTLTSRKRILEAINTFDCGSRARN